MVKATLKNKITGQIKKVNVVVPKHYTNKMDKEIWIDNQYRNSEWAVITITL